MSSATNFAWWIFTGKRGILELTVYTVQKSVSLVTVQS